MKPVLTIAAALCLAACGPLVQIGGNAKPPESLLTLAATAPPRAYAGPARAAETIAIDLPGVPATLQTLRLPVATSATEVTYLVGAAWAEQPNRQFQRLLVDTLAANGLAVIDQRQSNIAPARNITGTLREFGLDVRDLANPQVRVRYDAQLTGPRSATGTTPVSLRRFEASLPAPDQRPTAVAAVLNAAANQVAAEVAAWAAP